MNLKIPSGLEPIPKYPRILIKNLEYLSPKHEPHTKEPLSDKTRQKREGPPAVTLAAALILGIMAGMSYQLETSPQKREEKIEKIKQKILKNLAYPETQKEGMQLVNLNFPKIDDEIIKKIIEIAEQETNKPKNKKSDLILETLTNILTEKKMNKEEIEKYIRTKTTIISCLLYILENENEINNSVEKENYRKNQYKNKIIETIKKICNPTFKNPITTANNFLILLDLSKHSNPKLSQWALEQINLLREKSNPTTYENSPNLNNKQPQQGEKITPKVQNYS